VAIGVSAGIERVPCDVAIPAGSLLVAFSDGLVERRTRDWSDGLDAVRRAVDDAPHDVATADLANRLLDVVGDERSDDTVVLVVRFT
jgi:serine phosphatase RsbU (regulator of sigma subunit)